ncbi:MAG TPA: aminotransferase class IV [Flavisolibacter sp.]|jgi:branched-chain amino acid aminotransferase|nr:aminotransferase class IV [Flavisolibacter sp.]
MQVFFDGKFFPADAPLLPIQNRSFKWGDGVFETMKVYRGKLLLEDLHFERLLTSIRLLGIATEATFTQNSIVGNILELCRLNGCLQSARIRLAVYRQDNGTAGYSIEATLLPETVNQWQEEGQEIALYPFARKSMDAFANLKSANFLPYVLAQQYASEKNVDDAIVLNAKNFLCDTSRANIFLVRGKNIYTPALHQGCVNGVMRRVVLEECKKLGYRLYQDEVEESQLLAADEVFLSNAIQVIRWVSHYKTAVYDCTQSRKIFDAVSAEVFRGLS